MLRADFGVNREAYDSGRRKYSMRVMEYIFSLLENSSRICDIGCGTGIATRQLVEKIENVFGVDIDKRMTDVASRYNDRVYYIVSSVEHLPFRDLSFEGMTAFGAFHWFCNSPAVGEIRRTLKNEGIFIAVSRYDKGDFRKHYEEIVKSLSGHLPPSDVRENYHPEEILSLNEFSYVHCKTFTEEHFFSEERFIQQIQSMSLWNEIPSLLRMKALKLFETYFERNASQYVLKRDLEVKIVSGVKNTHSKIF